jgi:hypothetical protein
MATLAKLLQVDMGLPEMAKRLASAGRGKDTILAHINPKEAKLLKSRGGSGTINPDTGIMEFKDQGDYDPYGEANFGKNRSGNDEVNVYPTEGIVELRNRSGFEETSAYPSTGERGRPSSIPNQYQIDQAAAQPQQSYAPAAQDPAQQQAAAQQQPAVAPAPAARLPGQLPSVETPSPQVAAEFNKQTAAPTGGFMAGVRNLGNYLGELNKALSPVTPYLKGAGALYGAAQGNKASEQMQQQDAANEAEIRRLSEPYRQQGQQLVALGQSGGLTAPQQKQLEIQRAVASQQMASSGVTGGTAQQQLEANLQQQASAFAQQNIDQGMKLMNISDEYIMKAMNTGYAQNKDAQSLAQDFYRSIAQFLEPEAGTGVGQANTAPK